MNDWIDDASQAIYEQVRQRGYAPDVIADILRAHAPPQPEWKPRPTCEGYWVQIQGKRRYLVEVFAPDKCENALWYGPIPEPPAQEN